MGLFGRLENLVPPVKAGFDQDRRQAQPDRDQDQQPEAGRGQKLLRRPIDA